MKGNTLSKKRKRLGQNKTNKKDLDENDIEKLGSNTHHQCSLVHST